MTSFYSWRLYFLTFEGAPRWGQHGHAAHEAHPVAHGAPADHEGVEHDERGRDVEPAHGGGARARDMATTRRTRARCTVLIPLAVLALGALVAGFAAKEWFIGHGYDAFLEAARSSPRPTTRSSRRCTTCRLWVALSPSVMMVARLPPRLVDVHPRPGVPARLAADHPLLYRFLLNKWYFDELYDLIFVRPALRLGRFLWRTGDGRIIDGLGPDGVAARVIDVTRGVVRLQTGYVYHYAFAMLIGVAALITWYLTSADPGEGTDARPRHPLRPPRSCRSSARPSS